MFLLPETKECFILSILLKAFYQLYGSNHLLCSNISLPITFAMNVLESLFLFPVDQKDDIIYENDNNVENRLIFTTVE